MTTASQSGATYSHEDMKDAHKSGSTGLNYKLAPLLLPSLLQHAVEVFQSFQAFRIKHILSVTVNCTVTLSQTCKHFKMKRRDMSHLKKLHVMCHKEICEQYLSMDYAQVIATAVNAIITVF